MHNKQIVRSVKFEEPFPRPMVYEVPFTTPVIGSEGNLTEVPSSRDQS